ncbi:Acetyltransferase [Phytophthora megakarya]|uniref:Acetyltransferase n=1 Tax=Phytophthora megakarya TaxID=4795 RepID=A0A225UTL8_9STRA|nr:Acetyltransferase [Phytophthora megakarya]
MASVVIDRRGAMLARGVLVMVHDLYGGSLPLRPLETYLHVRGYDVQPFRFQPWTQNLATSGRELATFLKSQKPHTTDEATNFVTHGYGALVLRETFRSVDWNYTKSKAVMLAPPNRGFGTIDKYEICVCTIRYLKSMKKYVGVAGYGGVAAEVLATLSSEELDLRLGKLPRRCFPLVLAGKLCLNPFNQHNYPNDGLVMVEETELPGEFRHQVIGATHYWLPSHPSAIGLTSSFLEA